MAALMACAIVFGRAEQRLRARHVEERLVDRDLLDQRA